MSLNRGFLAWPVLLGGMTLFGAFAGCSAGEPQDQDPLIDDDPVSSQGQELKKGAGGVNCDGNYCDGAVLCGLGEGDCDLNSQCDQTTAAGPLICVQNNGAKFGCPAGSDVCAPATCNNRRLDPGETQIDCGGNCGSICPQLCVGLPANGLPGHCSASCPCASGEGDCNGATTCVQNGPLGALVCPSGNGSKFGFSSTIEMCVPTHCTNRVLDAALGETSKDCGGDCGTVCGTTCGSLPASGNIGHCTTACPCSFKDGDCDLATQCAAGGSCLQDRGDSFGFSPSTDVCVAAHCTNAAVDGGETALNCGGPDCAACAGDAVKVKSFGGASSDYAQAVALDAAGNVYLVFRYVSSPFDIGLGNVGNSGKYDILLAKFSPTGVPLWNHRFGNIDADGDHNVALAVDPAGNAYLVANFYGTVNLGGSDLIVAGATDVYVAKFDPSGGYVWAKSFGGNAVDRLRHIVVDPAGDVVIVGYYQNSITFGASTYTSAGNNDAFVAKLSRNDGSAIWSHSYGSTQDDRAYGVATDNAGNVYVAGQIGGTVSLGLGTFTTISGQVDAFLLKLTSGGVAAAATTFGGTTRGDLAATVGVDSTQRPIMTGSFTSNIDFGSGVFDPALSDVFVVAYDANLTRRWAKHIGGPGYDYVADAVVSPAGDVALVGYFGTSIDLGAGAIAAQGSRDIFALRYTSAGAVAWSHTYGGGGLTEPMALALSGNTLHLAGYYEKTVPVGSLSLGPSVGGARDAFWIELGF
jgi:hypothetical protein